MINNEFNRLNEWASNFSQKNAKEQAEHLETVRNEFQQAITNAKDELTRLISIQSTNFSNWVDGHADRHGEVKRKLTELEQKTNAKKEL
jgi:molecular chaperone DnaK (HSP70)